MSFQCRSVHNATYVSGRCGALVLPAYACPVPADDRQQLLFPGRPSSPVRNAGLFQKGRLVLVARLVEAVTSLFFLFREPLLQRCFDGFAWPSGQTWRTTPRHARTPIVSRLIKNGICWLIRCGCMQSASSVAALQGRKRVAVGRAR